jgi:biotin transport system substrate-specific component
MKKIKTTELTFAALMTALMAILSQIAVPLPFAAIVFNLGFVGIFLAGALQKPRGAFLSIFAYVMLGAVGVPVFANFKSGIGTILGPTGGFIIAYPVAAFIIALICEKMKSRKFIVLFVSMLAGAVLCYAAGTLWYMIYAKTTVAAAFAAVAAPFLLPDAVKAFASSALCLALLKIKNRITAGAVNE